MRFSRRTWGTSKTAECEETNICSKDARDRAADRDAEAHELYVKSRDVEHVGADIPLFEENPKFRELRPGRGTYGYCVWRDASVSSPSALWTHYGACHKVN